MTGALLDRFSKYTSPDDMVERLTRYVNKIQQPGYFRDLEAMRPHSFFEIFV
jgi:hypothetical protein